MKVVIALTIYLLDDVPNDYDEKDIVFRVEENYCHSNYIDVIASNVQKDDDRGVCNICCYSQAKYIGKATAVQIERGFPTIEEIIR